MAGSAHRPTAETRPSQLLDLLGRCAPATLEYVLERMIVPQLVELDIFLEAFERGVPGELLEAGDVDALRDAARDRAAPQAVAGEARRVKPGKTGPVLDDQRDRIGVNRTGTNPVAVGYRLSPCPPRDAGRRQPP